MPSCRAAGTPHQHIQRFLHQPDPIVKHVQSGAALKSIHELSAPKLKVWDQQAGVIGGREVTLNTVEHELLRGAWDEPNVHACIVCASASCPNLREAAFTADGLAAQMAERMQRFVGSSPTRLNSKGLLFAADGVFRLSRIFLWFWDDFGGRGDAAAFAVVAARTTQSARPRHCRPSRANASCATSPTRGGSTAQLHSMAQASLRLPLLSNSRVVSSKSHLRTVAPPPVCSACVQGSVRWL